MATVALRINGELVDDSVLASEAEALRLRFEQLTDEQRQQYGLTQSTAKSTAVRWARENVIEQVLLRQAALADRAPLDAAETEQGVREAIARQGGPAKFAESGVDLATLRAEVETRLKIQRLIARTTSRAKAPKTREVATFYRRNKEQYRTVEQVRAAHIVKNVEKGVSEADAREAAEALHARLEAGISFEKLADEQSDCPGNGGDLGYFERGKMVREFDEVVFGLRVGETSEVFQTVFGFHIAKVLDRRPAGLRSFREVSGEIRERLLEERRTKLLENYVDRLRASAEIVDRLSETP